MNTIHQQNNSDELDGAIRDPIQLLKTVGRALCGSVCSLRYDSILSHRVPMRLYKHTRAPHEFTRKDAAIIFLSYVLNWPVLFQVPVSVGV